MNVNEGKERGKDHGCNSRSLLIGLLLAACIFITAPLGAQTTDEAISRHTSETLCWGAGYFGDLVTHPGIYGVLKYPFRSSGARQGFVQVKAFNYYHLQNHVAFSLGVEVGFKVTGERGYFFDVSAGVGYLHTFLAGYTINMANWGRPNFMPSMGLTLLGWDLSKTECALPLEIRFLGLSVSGQYPFNRLILPHLAVEMGLTRKLSGPGRSRQHESYSEQ